MFNVAILGSTGSIGTQTIEVLAKLSNYRIYGLSANKNMSLLRKQIQKWHPQMIVTGEKDDAEQLERMYSVCSASGEAGLCKLATDKHVDIVVIAIVGFAGLKPTLAALKAGKKVALANKEALVAGGHLVMKYSSQIIPIDSEHSAIWQILDGKNIEGVNSLILTASGGPFYHEPADLSSVSPEQALQHPNWDMGGKISIDSATLMNKGLEIIEAHWLFAMSYDQIEVIIHPQSIIHSMVRFTDGSVLAQMGITDMRLPIQYALTYPKAEKSIAGHLDLASLPNLTFMPYDSIRFPLLALAYHVGKIGGTMPTVFNAANEVAVNHFLQGRLKFTDIPRIIIEVINQHKPGYQPDLEQLEVVDNSVRIIAEEQVSRLIRKD